MKINRNDPCSCGSGKKYKKCCLNDEITSDVEIIDFSWQKLRKTEGEVIDKHLLPFLKRIFPENPISLAFNEFCPDHLPDAIDRDFIFDECFIPWLLFNWIAGEKIDIKRPKAFDLNKTIAQNFLITHHNTLPEPIISFIKTMNQTYYSFYTIEEVVLNKSLKIRDILLGTDHIVKEKSATHTLKPGNIVCSRILSMNDQAIFIGMIPLIIPSGCYATILTFENLLSQEKDEEAKINKLCEFSGHEIIHFCFQMLAECYDRPLPELRNTDGDPIIYSTSFFKLKISPGEAFKKLLPLTLEKNAKPFESEGKRNKAGDLVKISFPWLKKKNKLYKSWDNTVMGDITINKDKLSLETNSSNRTEMGKELLSKYLGEDIEFKITMFQSPEQNLKSVSDKDIINDYNEDKLLASPEIQKHLTKLAKTYWQNWFDQKIPELKNQTPKEAAKTASGKKMLANLLKIYEHRNLEIKDGPNFFQVDVNFLRKKLGI